MSKRWGDFFHIFVDLSEYLNFTLFLDISFFRIFQLFKRIFFRFCIIQFSEDEILFDCSHMHFHIPTLLLIKELECKTALHCTKYWYIHTSCTTLNISKLVRLKQIRKLRNWTRIFNNIKKNLQYAILYVVNHGPSMSKQMSC